MPFCSNFKKSPFAKALKMSKETFLISNLLPKDVKIPCVVDKSQLMLESPDRKSYWFLEISLLAEKQLNVSLKVRFLNILPQKT